MAHEQRKLEAKLAKATGGTNNDQADEDALLAALGDATSGTTATPPADQSATTTAEEPPAPPVEETVQERLARYIAQGTLIPELTRDFGLPALGTLKVRCVGVTEAVHDANNQQAPVWLAQGPGGTANVIVDLSHDAFVKLGREPAEPVLTEVSQNLKVKADSDLTLSDISAKLRAACLPDTAVDYNVIRAQAGELLAEIRQRMADSVSDDPQRALSYLDPDEQTATANAMVAAGGNPLEATLSDDGAFLRHTPPLFLVKLLENWPEAFLDSRVFLGPYSSLTSASSKRLSLARVGGYMNDLATLLAFQTIPTPVQLRRTRLSVQLLQDELAPESP